MKKTISFLMPWNLQRIVETIGFGSSIVLVSGFLGPKVNNYLMQPMDWQKLNKYAIYFWDGGPYSVSPWTWICGVTNNCSGRLPSLSETMCYAAPPPLPGETQTPICMTTCRDWDPIHFNFKVLSPQICNWYFDVFKLCTNSSLGKKLSILESKKVPSSFLTPWVTLDQSTSRYQFFGFNYVYLGHALRWYIFLGQLQIYLRFCHLAGWGLCWKVFSCEPKDTCFHYLLKILH